MKLTIGTQKLQALLNKAIKGAGCNGVIPMTSLIAIKLKDGLLTLTTTDATNYFTVMSRDVAGEDFYVAVKVELLTKLVAKMTCENVTLEVTENSLTVSGNGEYQIALDIEDDGSLVVLPNPIESFNKDTEIGKVDVSVINTALMAVKPALAKDVEEPWYKCYYVGDSIMGTDTYTVADYNKGFLKEPRLISPVVMELLGLLSGDITVYANDNKMLFESEIGSVYAVAPNGIENYSITQLKEYVKQDFTYSCKVVKSALLKLLDRITLFAGEFDNGKITLIFDEDGLEVDSAYANEAIPYAEATNVGNFTCATDVITLAEQVKAQTGSEFVIEFGSEDTIKLIDGDITSIIALLDE